MGTLRAPVSFQWCRNGERVKVCNFVFNYQLPRGTSGFTKEPWQGTLRCVGERRSHRFWAYFSHGCFAWLLSEGILSFPFSPPASRLSPGRSCRHGNSILPQQFGSLNPSILILELKLTDKLRMRSHLNQMEGHS